MPRQKAPAPSRLTEADREGQTWNMGETSEQGSASGPSHPQEREYTVLFDDDYESSEDEDYVPPSTYKSARQELRTATPPIANILSTELDDMKADSAYFAEVRKVLSMEEEEKSWWSPIEKLVLTLDLKRHDQQSVHLPDRNQFWVSISEIPGRSFLLFEWFDPRPNESEKEFLGRQKTEQADHQQYFFIQDLMDRRIMDAFSVKQKVLHLKFHKYYDFTGQLELKVCLTSESLVSLSHPSDCLLRIPATVRTALRTCFKVDMYDLSGVPNLNHDIDALYSVVKAHHRKTREEREERVQVDPQHRSLLPKLRPYQAQAVRWMLDQERYLANLDSELAVVEEELHPLYQPVLAQDGTQLYFNKFSGYLVTKKPLAVMWAPGGILADEMGLGKTVEVLSCMLNNPRQGVARPDYLEPVHVEEVRRKGRRRKRSPSPTEFYIREDEEIDEPEAGTLEGIDQLVAQLDGGDTDEESKETIALRAAHHRLVSRSTAKEQANGLHPFIPQLDGGDTDDEDEDGEEDDPVDDTDDEDFIPPVTSATVRRQTKRGLTRKSTGKRTVYYHEDFDSLSSDDETVPRATGKRKNPPKRPKNGKPARKRAKMINTHKTASVDDTYATFQPYRNGQVPDTNTRNIGDMLVRAIVELTTDKSQEGVSVTQIRSYIKRVFDKDMSSPKFKAKFTQAVNQGVETGQFVKTSLGAGATGSLALNRHFDPDDSRSLYQRPDMSAEEIAIEAVITRTCYSGQEYSRPHIPVRLARLLETKQANRDKEKVDADSNKGYLYSRLKSVYEMSLDSLSLAKYARGESGREWRRSHLSTTRVEQKNFFECICGGTEEDSSEVGYRVQCTKCGTEQHAACIKYDITDPYRGEYVCPHCWVQSDKVESGATLIVSPSSISFQWIEEIQKHVKHKDIKMFYYKGAKEMGYIQPRVLASYDIVITTYETLGLETNYVDLPHSNSAEGRRFRNPKRFMAMPSPLTCIEWWRICLDEAQMIESTLTKTAQMALRLSGVNRWCVTGTPTGRSINDLHGLMLFLQVDPYMIEYWWRTCIFDPFCHGYRQRLEELLCKVLWRTCKKDVLDQIDIPPQREEIHYLQFSPVEEHFYRRQHIEVSRSMCTSLRRYPPTSQLASLERSSLAALLAPLLRLRQGCCHPQAVRGQFLSLQKNTTLSMEELLDQLIKRAVNETEEAHRHYIAALNGLAGIDIIEGKFAEAAATYREALRSAAENEGRIKTDTLQRLHSISNLAELLEAGHPGIPPTLRDSSLRAEARELRERYMQRYHGGVGGVKDTLQPVTNQVEDYYKELVGVGDAWYQRVVHWVQLADIEDQLMKLVHEELAQFFDVVNEREFREIQAKYPSAHIIMYKIADKLTQIQKARKVVQKDMKELSTADPEIFLNGAVDCHLRVSTLAQKNKAKCRLCAVHDNIEIYENALFHFIKGEIKGSRGPDRASVTPEERKALEQSGVFLYDEQRRGTWSDSEAERLCRAVHKFARSRAHAFQDSLMEEANTQMRLLEALKKEFRLTRVLWRQIFDQVAGVDELNMSTLRLRLRYEDEPAVSSSAIKRKEEKQQLATRQKEKVETIYILEPHELDQQRLKLIADKTSGQAEMKKKMGQLLYLTNLKHSDYGKKGGHNPDPCPICQKELGSQWSVLQCGHCYCVECIRMLIAEYSSGRQTKCAVCRSMTAHAEISYVSTRVEEEEGRLDGPPLEDIKGSHSTKVEAVVKTLAKVNADDPEAKSLVFSTWPDVLDIIAAALDENDIPYAALHGANSATLSKFKRNLQKFKNREDVKVLLLPVSRGANGLNLIEASHVLLVEPILNPGQELQAVGRIHRIGQKRSTVIHRFLVRQTIEERIQEMLTQYHLRHRHESDENLLTIQDLRNLFYDEEPPPRTAASGETVMSDLADMTAEDADEAAAEYADEAAAEYADEAAAEMDQPQPEEADSGS